MKTDFDDWTLEALAEECKKIKVRLQAQEGTEEICKEADRLLREYQWLRHNPSSMPQKTLTEKKAGLQKEMVKFVNVHKDRIGRGQ